MPSTRQWQKETGKKAVISYAASSALAKQIEQGAPAQVFISADLDWMDYLARKNLIKADTRSNLLGNRIVLIAPKDKAQAPWRSSRASTLRRFWATGASSMAQRRRRARPASTARPRSRSSASGAAWPARSRRPRTCARRCCWSRAARRRRHRLPDRRGRRPAAWRSSAPSRRTRHPPIIYPAALTRPGAADDAAAFLAYLGTPARPSRCSRRRASRCSAPGDLTGLGIARPRVWTKVFAPDWITLTRANGRRSRLSLRVALVGHRWAACRSASLRLRAGPLALPGQAPARRLVHLPLVLPPVVTGYLLSAHLRPAGSHRRLARRVFRHRLLRSAGPARRSPAAVMAFPAHGAGDPAVVGGGRPPAGRGGGHAGRIAGLGVRHRDAAAGRAGRASPA